MANVAVIGAQWGDEGKGKIVDWLSERAEVVVRFQGGHNAGHTLVIGNQTYKLALLPSGVVREGKLSIIGNGVVVDPWHFLEEVKKVTEQGLSVTPANLKIANHAVLILPLHRDLDGWREDAPGVIKIGTTRRGIGPAYEDKVGRRAIRVGDLGEPDMLPIKVNTLLAHHNPLRTGLGHPPVDADQAHGRSSGAGAEESCRSPRMCGSGSTRCAPPASASCSRARKPPCSTSTTAPIRSSPRRTPWRRRR